MQDNGLGITAEKKELVFTRYTRLKTDVDGNGIGLYLVKNIIQNAGGEVWFESKPGKGAEFMVSLPATA